MCERYKQALIDLPKTGYIPLDKLELGKAYAVKARNFCIAIWDGKEFVGVRHKHNATYISTELHWDSCKSFGTVRPLYELA